MISYITQLLSQDVVKNFGVHCNQCLPVGCVHKRGQIFSSELDADLLKSLGLHHFVSCIQYFDGIVAVELFGKFNFAEINQTFDVVLVRDVK